MTRDEYLAAIRVIGQWEQDNDCDIEGRPMPPRHITALMDRIEEYSTCLNPPGAASARCRG
jgi:hypothetical protein